MRNALKNIFRPEALMLIGILAVGAYLRLYRISEYMTFLGDEGRDMLVIKRMIVDHKFTLLGPTASVGGFFLGPIYYYFMLPFVWASGLNPVGAAVMVALFGIATIYLVYRIGRDMFDPWVGLMASSLYAVSPIVIAYSRSSWNPNVVPFFSTLLMYLLWRSVSHKHPALLFWVGITIGIGLQLHYLFLFLAVATFVWYLLFGRSQIGFRYYLLGCIGFIVGYGPFLAFELRHAFPNTISIFNFLREGEGTGLHVTTFWKTLTDVSYRLFGRFVFRLPPPEQWVNLPAVSQYIWAVGTKFSIVSFLGLLISYLFGWLNVTHAKKYGYALLLIWFLIPLILFGFYKKGIYDYYFGIFFALPFLATALILRSAQKGGLGKFTAAAAFIGIVYFNWLGMPFRFPPNNQLAQARNIAQAAYEKTDGKPYNFALLANFNSDHAYRYFFEIWGNPPVTIENVDNDPKRQTVTDQLIIICELPECKPLGHPLWEIAGFGRAEIAGEWQVSFVKIMKLVHYATSPNGQ
ncbi:MAG TPA: glycosyltransferase family 39 protein [Patescibacteria group bacterium]|nr:glycosyltransferase family 39 protein [Patescibacteria group bacterium]